jgi:uncharacterized protein YgiM (DUF1202 family)
MKGSMQFRLGYGCFLGIALAATTAVTAWAAPGDVHRVTAERVNLRAGPSDASTVRSTVEQGEELIELQSEGGWLGVRVTSTGEEGWIFSDLVEQVSRSQLGDAGMEAGFQALSEDFDQLFGDLGQQLGYRLVETVEQAGNNTLRITPSPEFLLYGGRDAHMATTLAIYQMWKNHQNGQPVAVALLNDENEDYISISDEPSGPQLTLQTPVPATASAVE